MTDYNEIIDQIEAERAKNNSNWMDILRLAFKHDPVADKAIMRKINSDDSAISNLLKQLSE